MNNSVTLCLAPIRGITDAVFRQAFTRHFGGFDMAIAPFIKTVKGGIKKESILNDLWPDRNASLPVIPQILSKSPDDFLLAATKIAGLGYETINWNLGCPHPVVTKKGLGAGLIPHPLKVDRILHRVDSGLTRRI